MNLADWIIVAVFSISALIGFSRGLVKEALSLVIWVTAFVVAMLFRSQLSSLLVDVIQTPSLRELVAFGLLFISTLVVGSLVSYLIKQLIKMTGLSGTDRFLGMLFGALRGLVVVMTVLIWLPQILPVNEDVWWQQSSTIPQLLKLETSFRQVTGEILQLIQSLITGSESRSV